MDVHTEHDEEVLTVEKYISPFSSKSLKIPEDKSNKQNSGSYLRYKVISITTTPDDQITPSYTQGNLAVETLRQGLFLLQI